MDAEYLIEADRAREKVARERYTRRRETQAWKSSHADIQLIGDRLPSPSAAARVDQLLSREADDIKVALGWEKLRNE